MAKIEFKRDSDDVIFAYDGAVPVDWDSFLTEAGVYRFRETSAWSNETVTKEASAGDPEAFATDHWLLGDDNLTHDGLKNALNLSAYGSGITSSAFGVRAQGVGNGLVTDYPDGDIITMCAVVKPTANLSLLIGNYNNANADGGGFYNTSSALFARMNGATGNTSVDSSLDIEWQFIAVSVDGTTGDYVYFRGQSGTSLSVSGSGGGYTEGNRNVGIGNLYWTGGTFANSDMECAEFMVGSSKLNILEIQDVYTRSIARMSPRGITI